MRYRRPAWSTDKVERGEVEAIVDRAVARIAER
jgi:hypothetical protein